MTAATATTTAATASDVGEYTIAVSGGRSENYVFSYVSGKLTIVPAEGTLTITGNSHQVTVGQTMYLQAHLNGFRPNVIWSSSDENVAVVDENGKVTIVGAGSATITAKLNERNFVADDATFLLETTRKAISLLPKTTVFTYNGMVQNVEFLSTDGFTPVVGENVKVTYTLTTSSEEVELRNAGITDLHVGLESGSDRVLRLHNKGETAYVKSEFLTTTKPATPTPAPTVVDSDSGSDLGAFLWIMLIALVLMGIGGLVFYILRRSKNR